MKHTSTSNARHPVLIKCLWAVVVWACSLTWLLTACGGSPGEDARRRALVVSLKAEVEKHFQQHGEYPAIDALSMPDKELLISYLKSGVIRYRRGPDGKDFFVISCIFTGPFMTKDNKYSTSWNGIQYSNKREMLAGVQDTWEPDRDGFHIWDLH